MTRLTGEGAFSFPRPRLTGEADGEEDLPRPRLTGEGDGLATGLLSALLTWLRCWRGGEGEGWPRELPDRFRLLTPRSRPAPSSCFTSTLPPRPRPLKLRCLWTVRSTLAGLSSSSCFTVNNGLVWRLLVSQLISGLSSSSFTSTLSCLPRLLPRPSALELRLTRPPLRDRRRRPDRDRDFRFDFFFSFLLCFFSCSLSSLLDRPPCFLSSDLSRLSRSRCTAASRLSSLAARSSCLAASSNSRRFGSKLLPSTKLSLIPKASFSCLFFSFFASAS